MRSFKDTKGRTWQIEFNLLTVRNLEQADWSAFDGMQAPCLLDTNEFDFEDFNRILNHRGKVAFVAWVCVIDQAENVGVTEDDFCAAITGDVSADIKRAVWEELADFFPEHRTVLLKLKEENERLYRKVQKKMADRIAKMPFADQLLDKEFEELDKKLKSKDGLGLRSTSSQAN